MKKRSKVETQISNAILSHVLRKEDWFNEVRNSIAFAIERFPKSRDRIIVNWLCHCEALRTPLVKKAIEDCFIIVPRG